MNYKLSKGMKYPLLFKMIIIQYFTKIAMAVFNNIIELLNHASFCFFSHR